MDKSTVKKKTVVKTIPESGLAEKIHEELEIIVLEDDCEVNSGDEISEELTLTDRDKVVDLTSDVNIMSLDSK